MTVSQITTIWGGTGRRRAPKQRTTGKRAATTALALGLVGAPLLQAPASANAGGGATSGAVKSGGATSHASHQKGKGGGAKSHKDARTYTVRSGDTLSAVADRFGVSWRALYQHNNGVLDDPALIYPGQRLTIPGAGSSGGSPGGHTAQGAVAHSGTFGHRVLAMAERLEGIPYVYGAETPGSGFDCSGFTSYIYAKLGKQLPRTAAEQHAAATQVAPSQARPGDLVFFHGSGGVYHVAIYAGGHKVWQSPRPGRSVELAEIWTSAISFGRF
ncbi:MAG: NlpC/P60 family protein [Carbonactinosporaceae bacterium]